ncbi:MAG: SpoIIE family protein phosphatase [Bacteroidetes bacterium]|jgi:serine phosphatase RsbU (regulator of sigma subunit)|nr:SpoIIE family protein phosphatase [Bacteroidota bacterium]
MKKFIHVLLYFLFLFLCGYAGGYFLGSAAEDTIIQQENGDDSTIPFLFGGMVTIISLLISTGFYFLLRSKKRAMDEKGAVTEDERLLEPFYRANLKERLGVIVSVALLGSLPLIVISTLFKDISPPWNTLIIGGAGVLLLVLVGLYAVILFKKSRDFYDRHELILIPAGFFLLLLTSTYYLFTLGRFEQPEQITLWSIIVSFYSIAAITTGVKLLLSANRTIFDHKARAENELSFASEVQQQFLQDQAVESDSIQGFGSSVTARQVGGDYFYLQKQDDGSVVAAVGDVSGHSFGAGLIMSMLVTKTEDYLAFHASPAGLLDFLNQKLLDRKNRKLFATMGVAWFKDDTIRIWNAGHMPVLHYSRSKNTLEKRTIPGFALGMTSSATYKPIETKLQKGDIFILYSDGLVETRDEKGNIRDTEEFYSIVEQSIRNSPGDCEAIAQEIKDQVFSNDHSTYPEDDSTIIVLMHSP